jgi:hypothetical protein
MKGPVDNAPAACRKRRRLGEKTGLDFDFAWDIVLLDRERARGDTFFTASGKSRSVGNPGNPAPAARKIVNLVKAGTIGDFD